MKNQLFVYEDDGTTLFGVITPGKTGHLQNSQCMITAAGSSVSKAGNTLTLNVAVTFTAANFAGPKNVYASAAGSDGLKTGWVQVGTWTPAAPQPPTVSAVIGEFQPFPLVATDSAGVGDLSAIHLLVNTTSADQVSACSIFYNPLRNSSCSFTTMRERRCRRPSSRDRRGRCRTVSVR